MPTNTYVPIFSTTVSSAGSVTFSSIPQTYTDLVIVVNATPVAGDDSFYVQLGNGTIDTGTNYSTTYLYGTGSTALSGREANTNQMQLGRYGTAQSVSIINIMNYSNTTTYKTGISRANNPSAIVMSFVSTWRSTAAVNILKLNGTFAVGTTVSLYGIASEEASAKATGGIVTSDSTYFYHTFLASGTFTPKQSLTCDYLVVAGGGGGGGNNGAGGGAGGLRSTVSATGGGGTVETALSLSATAYTVTVGAGGAGNSNGNGTNGNNSVFGSITSTAGGGGGGLTSAGSNGGSGGGGCGVGNAAAGTGTANQGYAGGAGTTNQNAGGGGGAGQIGEAAQGSGSNQGGKGGNGVQITALATPTSTGANSGYYAGGGGGGGGGGNPAARGTGGFGGGGQGGHTTGITAATANTGGGGGGGAGTGEAGGSGIVIVRYLK